MLYFLLVLPFLFLYFLPLFYGFFQPQHNFYPNVNYDTLIKTSFYSCAYAYDVNGSFSLNRNLRFNNIEECKNALLSFGYVSDSNIPNFLESYCDYYFKGMKVSLNVSVVKLTDDGYKIIKNYTRNCNGELRFVDKCYSFIIPSIAVNENGRVKKDQVYVFKICY